MRSDDILNALFHDEDMNFEHALVLMRSHDDSIYWFLPLGQRDDSHRILDRFDLVDALHVIEVKHKHFLIERDDKVLISTTLYCELPNGRIFPFASALQSRPRL